MLRVAVGSLGLLLALLVGTTADAAERLPAGAFRPAGSLDAARYFHTATLLSGARVLVVGGWNPAVSDDPLPFAEIFDHATATSGAAGSLNDARGLHTATRLLDGRVLVIGGVAVSVLASAEVWDPETSGFNPAGTSTEARAQHTATLLSDGRVLVAGGSDEDRIHVSAESWDPETGSFSPTGSLVEARFGHTATPLPDGRVLIVGGITPRGPLASAEVWDPVTSEFMATGSLSRARAAHTATLLPDGRVLVIGGGGEGDAHVPAEIWDPATESFSEAGSASPERAYHSATLLPDGSVLVIGGWDWRSDDDSVVASADVWDPSTGLVNPAGSLSWARAQHTATLLPDGDVLVVGGRSGEVIFRLAEIWHAEPEPHPVGLGGRVEVPEEGFAVTFPEDWVVFTLGALANESILQKLEEADPAFAEAARRDIAYLEASDLVKLSATAGYADSPSVPGTCVIASTLAEDMSLDEFVKWDVAAMEVANAEFIVSGPEVQEDSLPAGDGFRVESSERIAGEVGYGTIYYLMDGGTVFMLACTSFDPPDDRWRSIAETFESMSDQEDTPSSVDPVEATEDVDASDDGPPGGRFGRDIGQGRIERSSDGFAITFPSDWNVEEVSAVGNEWIDEQAENPEGAAVITQLVWAGDEWLNEQCFVSDAGARAASPPAWVSLEQGVEHEAAAMARWARVEELESGYLDLPAGRAGLVEVRYEDGSVGQMYIFKRGERWLTLHCEAYLEPRADWLSIAHTLEFLPSEQ